MAVIKDMVTVFSNVFAHVFESIKTKKEQSRSSRLLNYLTWVILAVSLAYAGYFAYRWNIARREKAAQKIFSEAIQLFDQARTAGEGQDRAAAWTDVEGAFSLGYEQSSSSKLAPFFQLFQAHALSELGKHDEAIALTEKAVAGLSEKNKLFNFYKTKVALMKLDSKNQVVSDDGLRALQALAFDAENKNSDLALFYLGSYYAQKNDDDKAREAWQALIEKQSTNEASKSPFAVLAEETLKSLG